jgi:UDP-N-acetylmuramoylalanine--D-glutamate ligase
VGITGSSGKSTTTALTGEMLRASGRETWVGGNIGRPLIGHLDEMRSTDGVVMELSSFQLEFFAPWSGTVGTGPLFESQGWSPPVAAILNLTPNHLDRHVNMDNYVAAKYQIVNYQGPDDVVVLNHDDPRTRQKGEELSGKRQLLWFSIEQAVDPGTYIKGDTLVQRLEGREQTICQTSQVQLLGRHNLANTVAACTVAAAIGLPIEAMRRAILDFQGVEHRLELVRTFKGAQWYNDSIATAPERTMAALQAFDAPVVLLAGGQDKNLNWDKMAELTWHKVRHLILFGEASDLVEKAMVAAQARGANGNGSTQIHRAGTLDRAVEIASQFAEPGDVVLLSPGGTSFDAFRDFAQRGVEFRKMVWNLR